MTTEVNAEHNPVTTSDEPLPIPTGTSFTATIQPPMLDQPAGRKRLERRVRLHRDDYALRRDAHIFSTEEIDRLEQWCQPLYLERAGKIVPHLAKYVPYMLLNMGTKGSLRPFELAEVLWSQLDWEHGQLLIWGKQMKRSREQIEQGRPLREPKPRVVDLPKSLLAMLGQWRRDVMQPYYPGLPHILVRPSGVPLESTGSGGYVGDLMANRSGLPRWTAPDGRDYEDFTMLHHSRTESHNVVYKAMRAMFRETDLHQGWKRFASDQVTQRDRKGCPRNMRQTSLTRMMEILIAAGWPPGEAVEYVKQHAGHSDRRITELNYLKLAKQPDGSAQSNPVVDTM